MKKYLFVMSHAPHSGIDVQETLDIILTTAAFDQKVSLLFIDDGVFQLKVQQNPEKMELKDTASIFKALKIYEIEELYVEAESLQNRGMKPGDLFLPVQEVYRKEINGLMLQNDIVISD